jgi:hypothetical protein
VSTNRIDTSADQGVHEQPINYSEPVHAPLGEDERPGRDDSARLALRPLGPEERPTPLLVAVAVAAIVALATLTSVATVHDLAKHGGSLPGGILLAAVFLGLAWGMYKRRYGAVLGFEALLAFQIIVTSLALIVAETWLAAGLCVLSIGLAGWLFWKLVRVMGRIQAGERPIESATGGTDEAVR